MSHNGKVDRIYEEFIATSLRARIDDTLMWHIESIIQPDQTSYKLAHLSFSDLEIRLEIVKRLGMPHKWYKYAMILCLYKPEDAAWYTLSYGDPYAY